MENSHEIVFGMRGQGVSAIFCDANSYFVFATSGNSDTRRRVAP